MTLLARPQNDNRLTASFRIRHLAGRHVVERRTTGAACLAHESLWHELLCSTDRGIAERFAARAVTAFAERHPGAVARFVPNHADHEAGFASFAR